MVLQEKVDFHMEHNASRCLRRNEEQILKPLYLTCQIIGIDFSYSQIPIKQQQDHLFYMFQNGTFKLIGYAGKDYLLLQCVMQPRN